MPKKIIYIVGSPRSGSTLIYNAICSNKVFNSAMPENHLATNFCDVFFKQHQRNLQIEKKYFFESINETENYFKECLKNFFNRLSKKYNINQLALKSITLTPNINVLNMIYPEICYVMTVRDPRDTIVSMISVGERQKKLQMQNQFPKNIELLCNKINQSYRLYLDNKFKKLLNENVHTIKYEDFIQNPTNILNKMLKRYSIDTHYPKNFDMWISSSGVYDNINENENNPYKSNLWNKPLNNSRVGIYKNKLSQEEIKQINSYCENIMNIFNY